MRSLDFESHFLGSRLKLVLSLLFFDDLDFAFCQDLSQRFEDNYETSHSEELCVLDGAFVVTLNLELLTLNFDFFQVSVDSFSLKWNFS